MILRFELNLRNCSSVQITLLGVSNPRICGLQKEEVFRGRRNLALLSIFSTLFFGIDRPFASGAFRGVRLHFG